MDPVLELREVSKVYPTPDGSMRHALRGVSVSVGSRRKVAIVGRSGSGKSTFLHLAAGIDVPTSGEVRFEGRDLGRLSERERSLVRRDAIGIVFQFFHLLPHLTVRENVALPSLLAGEGPDAWGVRVDTLLDRVGLLDRAGEGPQKLSGGEMQRVAICRALVRRPRLVLADEPTGNLDDENGRAVMGLMLELVEEEGTSLVCVTHSREVAQVADEVWRISSGAFEAA